MRRGFTLFEILLALLVMSMIIVAGIEWSHRKHEESAAQQLGHRLFQYGLAVSEYARQNPDGYTADNLPPDTFYGVEWLKKVPNKEMCRDPNDVSTCETLLGEDFNFKIGSLKLTPLVDNQPDSEIHVQFYPPVSNTVIPMTVLRIEVGKVYRYNQKTREYDIDVSLDSRAVNFANKYHDQNGTAEITYTLAPLDETGIITGVPYTQGANVDIGYLRTDGTNAMDGNVTFAVVDDGVVFANGVKLSNFKSVGPDAGDVPNMPNNNFECPGAIPNDNSYGYGDFAVCRKNKGGAWLRLTGGAPTFLAYNISNSICFFTGMERPGNGSDSCRVIPATQDYGQNYQKGDWLLRLEKDTNTSAVTACFARCLLIKQ